MYNSYNIKADSSFVFQGKHRPPDKGNVFTSVTQSHDHFFDLFDSSVKIFTCRLVCGEFRQVCNEIGACRAISDSERSQNVLSGLVG